MLSLLLHLEIFHESSLVLLSILRSKKACKDVVESPASALQFEQFQQIGSIATLIKWPQVEPAHGYGRRGKKPRLPCSFPLILTLYSTIYKHTIGASSIHHPKPPAVAIVRQNGLSSTSCRDSVAVTPVCVTADLENPGGGWPTTGTSPFLRWPLAISRLGTDSKDLISWYSVWESGNII